MMRSNLIFDLDNTLLDFSASERTGLTKTFADFGVTDNAAVRATYAQINTGLWAQLERGEITREQLLARRFNTFLKAVDRTDLSGTNMEAEYRQLLNNGHQRVPGAKTLLTALHDHGYTILAGTNGNTETQKQRLQDSHLAPLFDGIYISEEIGYDKPAPQFFDAIFAHEHELHKNDTVMIGDGLNSDIRGGVNYGLYTVWVNLHHQTNTSGLHPTLEVHSLQELANKLLASA